MEEEIIRLFCYGTLLKSEIQLEVFNKEINGIADSISGYTVLNDLIIGDIKYPRLTKQEDGIVYGKIIELTNKQIVILDIYESDAYYRDKMKTDSGIAVEVYKKRI